MSLIQLEALIHRLHEQGAVHVKRGYSICAATPAVISNHLIEEATELQAACLFESREQQLEEAGDLLAILVHLLQEHKMTLDQVAVQAIQKINQVWTVDPNKVTAVANGFTRSGRLENTAEPLTIDLMDAICFQTGVQVLWVPGNNRHLPEDYSKLAGQPVKLKGTYRTSGISVVLDGVYVIQKVWRSGVHMYTYAIVHGSWVYDGTRINPGENGEEVRTRIRQGVSLDAPEHVY
jgi:phosphoribosyl-ATP pyrophosphohydrolase